MPSRSTGISLPWNRVFAALPALAAGGLGQLGAAILFVLNMWWRVRIPATAAPAAR